MADSIAAAIRKGWQPQITPQLRSSALLTHPLRNWAWIDINPTEAMPSLAQVLQEQSLSVPEVQPDRTLCLSHEALRHSDRHIDLRIASVNVDTLDYQGPDPLSTGSRAPAIMTHFSDHKVMCVCVQETRARTSQVVHQGPFLRHISAAQNGQGGTEIWLGLVALSTFFDCDIDASRDITTWHADERILGLRLTLPCFHADFVSFYAPQQGCHQ